MSLHRSLCLAVSIALLAACQPAEPPPAPEASDAQADADAAAATAPAAEGMPVQEPSPDEIDFSLVPDFAWTLGDDAARVLGTASIYLAGKTELPEDHGLGTLPPSIDMAQATTIRFDVVEGLVGCAGDAPAYGPDGGQCAATSTDVSASNGYSASKASNRTMYLVGVFPVAPDAAKEVEAYVAPETDTETRVAPNANQVFLIGDGKTADGSLQTFVKHEGATTLYLGFADAYAFQGEPSTYTDNQGHLRYSYTLDPK